MSSKNKNKNQDQKPKRVSRDEAVADGKVVMKFSQDMYYKNYDEVHFEKDKEYVIEGVDNITRWMKRGGVIVAGEAPIIEVREEKALEVIPSSTVDIQPEKPGSGSDDYASDDENKEV